MGAFPATYHSPQPMDRVSNTCPGNSQHACDLKKLEEQPLGLCVFSSVHWSPEELLLHVTQKVVRN